MRSTGADSCDGWKQGSCSGCRLEARRTEAQQGRQQVLDQSLAGCGLLWSKSVRYTGADSCGGLKGLLRCVRRRLDRSRKSLYEAADDEDWASAWGAHGDGIYYHYCGTLR